VVKGIRTVTMVAIVATVLWALPGCSATSTSTPTTAAPTSAAPRRLSVRIDLRTTRVATGHPITGSLAVDNPGAAIDLTRVEESASPDCQPAFAVYLSNSQVRNYPGFVLVCMTRPFVVAHGRDRFSFTVLTSYFGCSPPAGRSEVSIPACLASGAAPALPPGSYRARIAWSERVPLPTPPPVPVVLTTR
jgi:hypothetical protein